MFLPLVEALQALKQQQAVPPHETSLDKQTANGSSWVADMNLDFLKNGQVGEVSEDLNTMKLVDLGNEYFCCQSLLES